MTDYTKEDIEASGLTHEDFMVAFEVLERAREWYGKEGCTREQTAINDAHAFIQDYQVLVAKAEASDNE